MTKAYENQAEWHKEPEPRTKLELELIRQDIQAGTASYGDIAELQRLAEYIPLGDVELLEAAGILEFAEVEA